MDISEDHIFKVSEITLLIKQSLEAEFHLVRIEGEISNFRPSSTGHLYFTLKDNDAVISAVMFRNRINSIQFQPEDGQLVIAHGSISVYGKRGTYQIICESLEKSGEGNILALLEERKRKLAEEGLFDESVKKPLPKFPSRIAVVTSPTGAALRDILRVLGRRNTGIDITILPAPVQGEEAAAIIARQIRIADIHSLGDVLIVGRGGGSLEDLLPFSDEDVVRAIASASIPVISAVGHEVDISLSDLAADVRAPTPSAAAEIVSASREELIERIAKIHTNINSRIDQRIERIKLLLRQFTPEALERNFRILIQPYFLRLDDAKENMVRGMKDRTEKARHKVELIRRELPAHSPQKILEKGFSLVTEKDTGKIIKSAKQRRSGESINVRVAAGSLDATVEEVYE